MEAAVSKSHAPGIIGNPRSGAHWHPPAIPQVISTRETASILDMDISSESDDEVHGGQYSLDSSPQDGSLTGVRHPDIPSSFTSTQNSGKEDRLRCGYGESSAMAIGSKLSSMQSRASVGCSVVQRRLYPTRGFVSDITLEPSYDEQEFNGKRLQNKRLDDCDIPSAPPFLASSQGSRVEEHVPTMAQSMGNSNVADSLYDPKITRRGFSDSQMPKSSHNGVYDTNTRSSSGVEATVSPPAPARVPTLHASGKGPWCAVISYDACVRLCLHLWYMGHVEAQVFLDKECALLRNAFGLKQLLLQPEEELLAKQSSESVSEGLILKPKRTIGKIKVQVRKVKMDLDPSTECNCTLLKSPKLKMGSLPLHVSHLKSTLSSSWDALRKAHVAGGAPANGLPSQKGFSKNIQAGVKGGYGILKSGLTNLWGSSSDEVVPESYSCLLRLKSSSAEDAFQMQPGSSESHVFFPDRLGDDLVVDVQNSKGKNIGHVLAQLALIVDDPGDKLRWWSIYSEPEHEHVGRIQLYIDYSTSPDESNYYKSASASVAETVAYDLVFEVAMKVQHFQQRNLLLYDPWKWLLTEFATYYGVSDAYAKLRYLSYIMDVATPTADCLVLVHDLLSPVLLKGDRKSTLSHQENRILGEVVDQIEQTLALVFENYKSLDESSMSGMMDGFRRATGVAAPALEPAIKLYALLHDILSPEAQLKLCRHFQVAAKKRSKRHLMETDELVASNNEAALMDSSSLGTAYEKMKSLCLSMKNEILTDIKIHGLQILPSFIDLPSLSSSIYSSDLCSRIRDFLVNCPPTGPSPPVVELVLTTADFQRDLLSWGIDQIKGGVDAKELFDFYINHWIKDKRHTLLESCKLEKVKWSGVKTQHSTTPFVDDIYGRLMETLDQYEVIISRWPEYTFTFKNALTDVEKAIMEALEKQYADVLSPLKELHSKKFGLKYVQTIAKGTTLPYKAPDELGILLNSMKRIIDVLRPNIESRLRSWSSCIPGGDDDLAPGGNLSEISVMLRARFRKYLQAVVEKLFANIRRNGGTRLEKIIKDSKDTEVESDIKSRMMPLKDLVTETIDEVHAVFEAHVFLAVCLGLWDRMGQDVLRILANRGEDGPWYKVLRIAVSAVDGIFASRMQQLLGNNAFQEGDIPDSVKEVGSMLFKDDARHPGNQKTYYF